MLWDTKYTEKEYARMLLKLFPPGDAFSRSENGDLFALMRGFGAELLRIDQQIHDLIKEAYPAQAEQLIDRWEIDTGFPDQCFGIPTTLPARRAQVIARIIYPGFLPTGWTGTGNITAGSAVITGTTNTDDLLIGDSIAPAAGFPTGSKLVVTDKTANTITLEQTANKTAATASLTAYFYQAEQSERFYEALLTWLGYTFVAFEKFNAFDIGPLPTGYASTGDPQSGSDTIINVASTAAVNIGDHLWISAGFDITGDTKKEPKVLAKTASTIQVDRNAAATVAGADLIGFPFEPSGMADPIGDGLLWAVNVKFSLGSAPADTDVLLKCVFNKLKQSQTIFLFETV